MKPSISLTKTQNRQTLCALFLGANLLASSAAYAEPSSQEIEKANTLFEQSFEEITERSPMELSRLGSKKFQDRWDDLSPWEPQASYLVMKRYADQARKLDKQALDPETELSLRLFLHEEKMDKEALEFSEYDYPVNQMFGMHSEVPAFLINVHQIETPADAEAYILRLERLPALFAQLDAGLLRREKNGILPPKFVFDYVLSDVDNLLSGYPLTASKASPNPIYADFEKKVMALKLEKTEQDDLLNRGQEAIKNGLAPAYRGLREVLADQATRATTDDGVWKFPKGAEYYAFALEKTTSTDMTAEEIHQLGLSEVAKIHKEMEAILKKVKFQGTLADFFVSMRTDPKFLYPNTAAGKAAYLKEATAIIDRMKAELDVLFATKPKADIVVKAVEPYREKSAGKAFYESPALDGSRPGYYYANLYDMTSMPKYQMEALAYHEGIPGHHMQLSIAQELEGLPKFRRLGGYTAYIEGWGLYCENLPKDYGFYQDPYSDFGRLAMELFRAVRLVVDTGIHSKKWTRQQALDYYLKNTPNSEPDCQKMVDRHIVMPGQATAYKVGMNEFMRLRAKAQAELGADFDIRQFHDAVLVHGAVPLDVLSELVDDYIKETRAGKS